MLMRLSVFLLIISSTASLLGCAGTTKVAESQKAQGYAGSIANSLLVIVDVSHYKRATGFDEAASRTAGRAIVAGISDRLSKDEVRVVGEVIDASVGQGEFATVLFKHPTQRKALLVYADSFIEAQRTQNGVNVGSRYWTGEVAWALRVFDFDRASNPEGKAVWSAKTERVQFSPSSCRDDGFKACGDRFALAAVMQLRADNMIGAR